MGGSVDMFFVDRRNPPGETKTCEPWLMGQTKLLAPKGVRAQLPEERADFRKRIFCSPDFSLDGGLCSLIIFFLAVQNFGQENNIGNGMKN